MTQTTTVSPLRHAGAILRATAGLLTALAASVLVACSSPAPAPAVPPEPTAAVPLPEPVAPPPAEASTAAKPTLAAEQRRLAALFRGTPVVFVMQPDGRLRVDVPLKHSFDAGRSSVKAPLAAVLDRVALSQAGGTSRIVVSAAGDRIAAAVPAASGASAASKASATRSVTARQERLAGERSKGVVDRLVAKGIAANRVSTSPAAPAGQPIRLLIDDRPGP